MQSENEKPNAWPYEEAERIHNAHPNAQKIKLETGYGPSGLPHIGTFAEVVRTHMIALVLEKHFKRNTQIICFTDDMDGLRSVPSNMPQQEMIARHIKIPIARIPDPFGCHKNYADHNMESLISMLDSIPGLHYQVLISSHYYTSGKFNKTIQLFADNYDKIMNIILPTLSEERQKTYSIILPISSVSGQVLEVPVKLNTATYEVTYQDVDGSTKTQSIFDGHCKLQWKADFAMRWINLGITYEMCGKDVKPSFDLSAKVVKNLSLNPPINLMYELFLDNNGHKISKSKGNEQITISKWLHYAPQETLGEFLFQNPKRARKLSFETIPFYTDSYIKSRDLLQNQTEIERLNNAAYYVGQFTVPMPINFPLTYSILLHIASITAAENDDVLWGFITRYAPEWHKGKNTFIDSLVQGSVHYYQDFILPKKQYRIPNKEEKQLLQTLHNSLESPMDDTTIEQLVYQVGKDSSMPLKQWFKMLYEVLLGQTKGPRMGSFISIYGVDSFKTLIQNVLNS